MCVKLGVFMFFFLNFVTPEEMFSDLLYWVDWYVNFMSSVIIFDHH
jgi:hypothetical protein